MDFDKRIKNSNIICLKKDIVGNKGGITYNISFPETIKKTLCYQLKFEKEFNFLKGGKLPGLAGGNCPTGGVTSIGFSSRLMWRENGAAELYLYHANQLSKYGDSLPFNIKFTPSVWFDIYQEFNNGLIVTKINNEKIVTKIDFNKCSKLLFHIFRGGKTVEWSSPTNNFLEIKELQCCN